MRQQRLLLRCLADAAFFNYSCCPTGHAPPLLRIQAITGTIFTTDNFPTLSPDFTIVQEA
jgi:hypothetical protein